MSLPVVDLGALLGPEAPRYFVDSAGRAAPLVVEQATGQPRYAYVEGKLIGYDEWRAAQQAPTLGPPEAMTIQSSDGAFSGTITVSNPEPKPS